MNKALFLDRDGIINVDKNYVHKIDDFEFVDGIFEVTRYFQERGYLIIVITNQAGIGRGYYTEHDFEVLTKWMLEVFKEQGVNITKVYHCPFHPTHGIGEYKCESFDRKPNPGMLLKAIHSFDIDPKQSILIGDNITDIEAGLKSGIKHNLLINNEIRESITASIILKKLDNEAIVNYMNL